jgi:Mn-dependent DtxR family transcriptional regulator
VKKNVVGLTREIMTMQAEGSYAKAKGLAEKLGVIRPEVQRALDKMTDIEPRFVTAKQLLRENGPVRP